MKSSTIRRSTLSKESMEVIENLSKDEYNSLPAEYVRSDEAVEIPYNQVADNKAQEIDLLWQSFKTVQFNSKSPVAYLIFGFIAGVISTLLVMFFVGGFSVQTPSGTVVEKNNKSVMEKFFAPKDNADINNQAKDTSDNSVSQKVDVPTDDEVSTNPFTELKQTFDNKNSKQKQPEVVETKTVKYIVKDGDTVESIIKRHYGSYSPEKAELIKKVNNMPTLDRININQELLIPVGQ